MTERRQVAFTAVLFALSLGWGLAGAHALPKGLDGYPTVLRVADLLIGVGGFALLLVRHRHSVRFAGYLALLHPLSTLSSALPLIAAYTVAKHRPWPQAAAAAALLAAGTAPHLLLYPDPTYPFVVVMAGSTLVLLVATTAGMFVRARREVLAGYRERAERAEADKREQVAAARRAERTRIAREMHDVLAHRLSLLAVHAGALRYRPDADPAELSRAVEVIRATAHDGLTELRAVIRVLREDDHEPGTAPPQPTLADLPALVADATTAGTAVDFASTALDDVPAAVGRAVYRVVQEGLTNARKHAPGQPVRVHVDIEAGQVRATVHSGLARAGRGTPIPGSGTGLVGLAERVTLLGGRLSQGPDGAGGYRLVAWLPLDPT